MNHCPICHARIQHSAITLLMCTRCGGELQCLLDIETTAKHFVNLALYYFNQMDTKKALDCLKLSLRLHDSKTVRYLYKFIESKLIPKEFSEDSPKAF